MFLHKLDKFSNESFFFVIRLPNLASGEICPTKRDEKKNDRASELSEEGGGIIEGNSRCYFRFRPNN